MFGFLKKKTDSCSVYIMNDSYSVYITIDEDNIAAVYESYTDA